MLKMQSAEQPIGCGRGEVGARALLPLTAPTVYCGGSQTASSMRYWPLPVLLDSRHRVTQEQGLAAAASGTVVVHAVLAHSALPRAALPAPPAMQRAHNAARA